VRRLTQPGPATGLRVESVAGRARRISYALEPGLTLNEALTRPLVAAGLGCAAISFSGAALDPFVYVVPHKSPDAAHVAWFSPPRAPTGGGAIEAACATFGWRDGAPFVHCHAVWREADGARRGGHIMPLETIVARGAQAEAWGCAEAAIEVAADAETNFSLFMPRAREPAPDGRLAVVRVRPNEDIHAALEEACRRQGFARAAVRASLGSLVAPRFVDGGGTDDIATEILVRAGTISPADGATRLDIAVVDMAGGVHAGELARGTAVCITFEAMLEALD
jgi:predicted DNA-binding protein with PD1-like motif